MRTRITGLEKLKNVAIDYEELKLKMLKSFRKTFKTKTMLLVAMRDDAMRDDA